LEVSPVIIWTVLYKVNFDKLERNTYVEERTVTLREHYETEATKTSLARIRRADKLLENSANLAMLLEVAGDDIKNLVTLINALDKAISPFAGKVAMLSGAIDKTRVAIAKIASGGLMQAMKQKTGLSNDVFKVIAFTSGVANGLAQLDTVVQAMLPDAQQESSRRNGRAIHEADGDMADPFPSNQSPGNAEKQGQQKPPSQQNAQAPVNTLQQAATAKFGPAGAKQFTVMVQKAFKPNPNILKLVGLGPNAMKVANAQALFQTLPFVNVNKVAAELLSLSPKEAIQLAKIGNTIAQQVQSMAAATKINQPDSQAVKQDAQAAQNNPEQNQQGNQPNTPVGVFRALVAKETGKNISDKLAQRFLDMAQQAIKSQGQQAATPEIPDLK
jgi:hypothetical protein